MEKITKSLSELFADDSCSSLDKAEELSQSGSVASTDTSDAVGEAFASRSEWAASTDTGELDGDITVSPSKHGEHSVSKRSAKRGAGSQRLSRSHFVSASVDTGEASASGSISTRSGGRKKNDATLKKLKHNQTMKFMENFDPERSNRERKKLTRQITSSGKRKPTLYDEKGVMMAAEVDLCDCLVEECPGCHFPCPRCHSNKCAHECRQNRRWTYEEICIEGTNIVITNPLLNNK